MPPSIDLLCARGAARQHGIITIRQLRDLGLSPKAIRHRISTGRLIRVHPGVLAMAAVPLSWRGRQLAAEKWSKGLTSHRAAAAIFGLEGFAERGRPEVTVTTCHLPPRSGILVHVTDFMPRIDVVTKEGMTLTSVERTILDLGAVVPKVRVAIALDSAVTRQLTTLERLEACLRMTARKGRRGCGVLRGLLEERGGLDTLPNSAAETLLFEHLPASPLPMPELQFEIFHEGEFVARPDFVWLDRRLALEMDSFKHHAGYTAWLNDRERLDKAKDVGWEFVHGTWREAKENPDALLERVYRAWLRRAPIESISF